LPKEITLELVTKHTITTTKHIEDRKEKKGKRRKKKKKKKKLNKYEYNTVYKIPKKKLFICIGMYDYLIQ